jgi:hypothetical protein
MSILTDDRNTVQDSLKKHIKDVNLESYPENSIVTDVLVNLPVHFNSVVSQKFEFEGINCLFQRINVNCILI